MYLGLSVIDFPFCFLAVRLIGPARIGEVEHTIVDGFWNLIGAVMPSMRPENRAAVEDIAEAASREGETLVDLNGEKHDNASTYAI